ncbi:MAG: penicillin-binding protein 1C [Bacteroidetes bacterium]|nr:penicillin-binding protein 1C [Bacteroidota bacterium]
MTLLPKKRKLIWTSLLLATVLGYYFCLPSDLFPRPFSTVLKDRNGQLLSAAIASDGQWRFPSASVVPSKFAKALITFEDKRFLNHWGIDFLAMGRAIRQNILAGQVVSGGSTLTMQVIRLSGQGRKRNVWNKLTELLLSTRLEFRYTKDEILALYAAHAPFGGNVVGLEAACWRYFGRDPVDLSWSEAALLAVLPNNPSLINLSRNRQALMKKRNGLLVRLYQQGELDSLGLQLSLAEPVPASPIALPRKAPHLLSRSIREGLEGHQILSTLDAALQVRVNDMVHSWQEHMSGNQIFNSAALVMDVRTGAVLAYVGNTLTGVQHNEDVDMVRARRSTGSILKPFLYAAMLDEGKLLPAALVSDIPVVINGYEPKNFSRKYDGVIPADKALSHSLNIPAVQELREYRYEKFHRLLKSLGMSTLDNGPDHYGLSLVLGGAEGTLWDLTGMYASCSRMLLRYFEIPGKERYDPADIHPPAFQLQEITLEDGNGHRSVSSPLSAASIWSAWEALKEMRRPGEETGWYNFSSRQPIAWKTGTSFGMRDGWAIGVTPAYAVGVWAGNADGEGRPGLTGTEAAAPLMFNIFSVLPGQGWFSCPTSEMTRLGVCAQSGYKASANCETIDSVLVPYQGRSTQMCSFHQKLHLTRDHRFRVHADCANPGEMADANWFVLPPIQEYYFRQHHLDYKPLPPYRKGCADPAMVASMDIIYPRPLARVYLPVQLDGSPSAMVVQVTHRNESATVFWHLDGSYLGSTRGVHELPINPGSGDHTLTLVDSYGETMDRRFTVLSSK